MMLLKQYDSHIDVVMEDGKLLYDLTLDTLQYQNKSLPKTIAIILIT